MMRQKLSPPNTRDSALMTDLRKAVFLSYASQDGEAARRLCDALRGVGIEVWFDRNELRGGDAWDQQIRKQILDCSLFIPVISANTEARHEGYFRLEWRLAVERKHHMADTKPFLVPVVIDATDEHSAEIPRDFRDVQWTYLPAGEASVAFIERISGLLLSPTVSHVPAKIGAAAILQKTYPHPTALRLRRHALPVIVVLALISIAYITVDKLLLLKRLAADTETSTLIAIPETSVAVLPFVDMSKDKDQEYFADGLSDELISELSNLAILRVPARTSSFYFKGKSASIVEISKALGVAHVLEGSVRRAGDTMRITAQLIRSSSGYRVWSKTYDRPTADILKIQDEISQAVAVALRVQFQETAAPAKSSAADLQARDLLLRGKYSLEGGWTQSNVGTATTFYREALKLNPDLVSAWINLSRVLRWSALQDWIPRDPGLRDARLAVEEAVRIQPRSAEAYTLLANFHLQDDNDFSAAQIDLARASKIDANNPLVLKTRGDLAATLGDDAAAAEFYQQALTLDPLDVGILQRLANSYLAIGRLDDASGIARRALAIEPNDPGNRLNLALILLKQGRPNEALAEVNQYASQGGRWLVEARAYCALGRRPEAEETLAKLEKDYGMLVPYTVAATLASCGNRDSAFRWLETALSHRDLNLLSLPKSEDFRSLHADPRWKDILERVTTAPWRPKIG